MFAWLKNWFRKENDLGIYKPDERLIYQYFDGQKMVSADPLRLYKKMMAVGPELGVDLKVACSPSKDAAIAEEAVVRKVKDIFGLKSLDEGGLSDMEVVDLFDHFLVYTDTVKKNSKRSVTSWAPTKSEASEGSTVENQPTKNTVDSGSTANEPSIEQLTPFPSESPTP